MDCFGTEIFMSKIKSKKKKNRNEKSVIASRDECSDRKLHYITLGRKKKHYVTNLL